MSATLPFVRRQCEILVEMIFNACFDRIASQTNGMQHTGVLDDSSAFYVEGCIETAGLLLQQLYHRMFNDQPSMSLEEAIKLSGLEEATETFLKGVAKNPEHPLPNCHQLAEEFVGNHIYRN